MPCVGDLAFIEANRAIIIARAYEVLGTTCTPQHDNTDVQVRWISITKRYRVYGGGVHEILKFWRNIFMLQC